MMTLEPIKPFGLLLGFLLMVLTMVLMKLEKIPLQKDLWVGTFRTVGQLIFVGYLLEYIFYVKQWEWVLVLLLTMIAVATQTAQQRLRNIRRASLLKNLGIAIGMGSIVTIFWVAEVVIKIHPWYHPQYLVPLGGMIIGNSMNSASLALDRFYGELSNRKPAIETLLSLGGTPAIAAQESIKSAILAAMIPNINAMMIVGIVSFPGMMTGQILAGQSPLSAVTYQIIVMFMLTCAGAITAVITTRLALGKFFNAAEQLVLDPPSTIK
jgi:putative ABC transport system permease protein